MKPWVWAYISFKWAETLCVLGLASVCSSSVQCYYKVTGLLLFMYKLINVQSINSTLLFQSFQQQPQNSFVIL